MPLPRRLRSSGRSRALYVLAIAGAVLVTASPPLVARCDQPALITTLETPALYSYIYTPGVDPIPGESMTRNANGYFWALGFGHPLFGVGFDNGSLPAVVGDTDGWLDLYPGYPASFLTTWAVDPRIDGCIDSATSSTDCTAVLLTDLTDDGGTWFTMLTAAENTTRDYLFNLPGNAPIVLAPLPPATVLGFDGSRVRLASPLLPDEGFELDPACAFASPETVVSGFYVYWYRQIPGEPPPTGRTPATDPTLLQGWQLAVGGANSTGGPLPIGSSPLLAVGCQPWDVYLSVQLVFDSGFAVDYLSDVTPVEATNVDLDGDGVSACEGDCDDDDASTFPGAPQVCDGVNNDCSDPGYPALPPHELDLDGDGFSECEGDCDPTNPLTYPGAPQVCDRVNNDCADPSYPLLPPDEQDGDGDGFGACFDCDDADAAVYPGAPQLCDGVNTDCDSLSFPAPPADEVDADADGFLACAECDDSNPAVYPAAPQICDGLNNDCDDATWPAPPDEEADQDSDGLGACEGDCDDGNPATFPGAPQICDGFNNDCEDPNWPTPPELEADLDGDGSPVCADCDDDDPRVYPLAPQVCDGINNDCLDPAFPDLAGTNEVDDDGDGFSECAGDCADDDPARNPAVPEDCDNGIDDDCDGQVDFFDMPDCRDLFVVLETFTATAESGGVRLRWTTSQEIDAAGFNVLRAVGRRPATTVTPRPIPARGDALHGADYEWLDGDRQALNETRYWLEEIDVHGVATRYGPIGVLALPQFREK